MTNFTYNFEKYLEKFEKHFSWFEKNFRLKRVSSSVGEILKQIYWFANLLLPKSFWELELSSHTRRQAGTGSQKLDA